MSDPASAALSPSVPDHDVTAFHASAEPAAPSPSVPDHDVTASRASAAPVELSARRLHDLALEAFRVGNRGRLTLCETLRVLGETRLYFDLGFPSLAAYAGCFFQLRRSETFEYVRVSKALIELTELREAFGRGLLGWSALKAITRVASVASQSAWIEFAQQHGIERTLAEARDALRRGREAPREASFGLPNLDQKLVLRFSRSDMDKVRTWIEDACAQVAAGTGAEQVSLEQAVLFLCELGMVSAATGDAPVAGNAPVEGQPSRPCYRAQVVYQRCPDCRKARVGTRDGFVEVAGEEVERFEGSADRVVIDGPTPPKLRRQILGREAQRCANPRCDHRAEHCHHVTFLSEGGKTTLANEVGVCKPCHALIHAGLLQVRGDANGELSWSAAVSHPTVAGQVAAESAVADRLPVLQVAAATNESRTLARKPEESAIADSSGKEPESPEKTTTGRGLDLDALAHGLIRLGVPAPRSRRLIGAALAALPPGQLTEDSVLRQALASI